MMAAITVILSFLVVAMLAWLRLLGVPLGIVGWITMFIYGGVTLGVITGAVFVMLEWFQTGRQKRAGSGEELDV